MKRIIAYLSVALLLMILAGCGATAKMIAARSQSERTDVFIEVTDTGAKPEGYIDLVVKANIKAHVDIIAMSREQACMESRAIHLS